ncbi:homoserine dehydrogenase [Clostridium sp. C8-1-8]|uniref:homoserine dehydrogenase n=1 Tax=Clostridium sp. C8-1-8 TaxID=2698831 RepID=UPI00136C2029|nr:homoserine dehydrogenase [Clostridium sp. C8-1-8]
MKRIALLGYGVVGTGLIELIEKNRDKDEKLNIDVEAILVKHKEKHENKKLNQIITDDCEEVFSKDWDILVEVIGGINPAYDYVKRALMLGKNVVTANKDLIAEYGEELFQIAKEKGVSLKFEASVAGGIPIIKPLTESLSGNDIKSIKGIINGTTNFILSKMYEEGVEYEEALKEAQDMGFAEANPDADVLGYDAARKLAILSTLAFKKRVFWKDIKVEGITSIDSKDFAYAKKANCKIKLLSYSKKEENRVFATVKPVLIDSESDFYRVNNEINSVILSGDAVGELVFKGSGAGMLPTASAVYGDIVDLAFNKNNIVINSFSEEKLSVEHSSEEKLQSLIRIDTDNKKDLILELTNRFIAAELLDLFDNEVALLVDGYTEVELEDNLTALKQLAYVNRVRKISKVS